ncbi:hypothetical protein [Paenibacillus sp. FSL L8-0506]|uniref:hypothetical protein n=1 Tax=Paenibacillus sp. FSL L8-0506 TaxID=2975335 RepID=UPI0030F95C6E
MTIDLERIKINAMANLPFNINGILIYPISLKQIVDMGYDDYNNNLSLLSIKKDQLVSPELFDSIPSDVEAYDIIYELYKDDALCKAFNNSLSFFCKTENIYYDNGLYIEGIKVDSTCYKDILKVIHTQNGIVQNEEDFNPKSERVKKLREKQLENRKKIQKLKKDSGNGSDLLTFFDLVSIICSNANGINVFNVFDLNMFQFNDQFNRMKLLNDYETSIQSLLHGADPKNIEIKHWISKS